MKGYSESDKDNALRALYGGVQIASEDLAALLKADGLIATLTSPNGRVTRLTDKGIAFLLNGGYAGARKAKEKESRSEFKRNIVTASLGAVAGAVAGGVVSLIVTWLRYS